MAMMSMRKETEIKDVMLEDLCVSPKDGNNFFSATEKLTDEEVENYDGEFSGVIGLNDIPLS